MNPVLVDGDFDLQDVKELFEVQVGVSSQVDALSAELAEVKARIKALEAEKKTLLGIEKDRLDQIKKELGFTKNYSFGSINIQHGQKDLPLYAREYYLECQIAFLRSQYDTWMSLDPLTWRNVESGYPVFALFHIRSATVSFENDTSDAPICPPEYPNAIRRSYADLGSVLDTARTELSLGRRSSTVELATKFSGTIPRETRDQIAKAIDSGLFGKISTEGLEFVGEKDISTSTYIYLLTEVDKWELTAKPVPVRRDPIVVGWTPLYPDRLWYIDAFDITPLENQIPLTSR